MLHDFTSQFWANTVDGLTVGSIYALVALGYTMVYGVLRLINFAHSEIFMIGTFGGLTLIQVVGFDNGPYTGIALVGVLLACLVASMVASGGAALRPVAGSKKTITKRPRASSSPVPGSAPGAVMSRMSASSTIERLPTWLIQVWHS